MSIAGITPGSDPLPMLTAWGLSWWRLPEPLRVFDAIHAWWRTCRVPLSLHSGASLPARSAVNKAAQPPSPSEA